MTTLALLSGAVHVTQVSAAAGSDETVWGLPWRMPILKEATEIPESCRLELVC